MAFPQTKTPLPLTVRKRQRRINSSAVPLLLPVQSPAPQCASNNARPVITGACRSRLLAPSREHCYFSPSSHRCQAFIPVFSNIFKQKTHKAAKSAFGLYSPFFSPCRSPASTLQARLRCYHSFRQIRNAHTRSRPPQGGKEEAPAPRSVRLHKKHVH